MIDKLNKLVAVAEEMATKWNESGECVEGVVVEVEGNFGVVRIGVHGIIGSNFSHDDNVHFPEYGVVYYSEPFNWEDGGWKEALPQPMVWSGVAEEDADELPF
jgi:hypothetical protein